MYSLHFYFILTYGIRAYKTQSSMKSLPKNVELLSNWYIGCAWNINVDTALEKYKKFWSTMY